MAAADKVREGGTEVGVRVLPCADGWVSFMPISEKDRDAIGEALAGASIERSLLPFRAATAKNAMNA